MSSLFESEVRQRRDVTPCARIDLGRLMRRLALHDDGKEVTLSVRYRPDVASRMWWEMRYTARDGHDHVHWSQDLDLLLWRVATAEAGIDQKMSVEQETKLREEAEQQANAALREKV